MRSDAIVPEQILKKCLNPLMSSVRNAKVFCLIDYQKGFSTSNIKRLIVRIRRRRIQFVACEQSTAMVDDLGFKFYDVSTLRPNTSDIILLVPLLSVAHNIEQKHEINESKFNSSNVRPAAAFRHWKNSSQNNTNK